jgi:V/A-type H+/Na+-transporting ATPase subunit D
MADVAPSRSAILELRDERQAMVEGHAFLDEKCLAIAAEIVKELSRYLELEAQFRLASREAARALAGAIARHGLEELNLHPAPAAHALSLAMRTRPVMGVKIATATLAGERAPPIPPDWGSPEANACSAAFAGLLALAPQVGAAAANLERLSEEYRRSIRRARALDDVLIPEAARELSSMETALEDLEREDAIAMRLGLSPRM